MQLGPASTPGDPPVGAGREMGVPARLHWDPDPTTPLTRNLIMGPILQRGSIAMGTHYFERVCRGIAGLAGRLAGERTARECSPFPEAWRSSLAFLDGKLGGCG